MSDEQNQLKQNIEDEDKKVYGCPCGKKYLSYPALFTHIKQKHDGNPPGQLIKPRGNKSRGRPRIHIEVPQQQMNDSDFNLNKEILKILSPITIDYDKQFIKSQGDSCQGMLTNFLKQVYPLKDESQSAQNQSIRQRILNCFCNYLMFYIQQRYGRQFWQSQKPAQIIDISNQICHKLDDYVEQFPIPKSIMINLIYLLFRWMYVEKWTEHKLVWRKKPDQNVKNSNNKDQN